MTLNGPAHDARNALTKILFQNTYPAALRTIIPLCECQSSTVKCFDKIYSVAPRKFSETHKAAVISKQAVMLIFVLFSQLDVQKERLYTPPKDEFREDL